MITVRVVAVSQGQFFAVDQVLLLLQLALPALLVQLEALHDAEVGHEHEGVVVHEGELGLELRHVLVDLVVAVAVLRVEVGENLLHKVEHRLRILLALLSALLVESFFLNTDGLTSPELAFIQKMWTLQESELTASHSAPLLNTKL